jgi:hypothetical protein
MEMPAPPLLIHCQSARRMDVPRRVPIELGSTVRFSLLPLQRRAGTGIAVKPRFGTAGKRRAGDLMRDLGGIKKSSPSDTPRKIAAAILRDFQI